MIWNARTVAFWLVLCSSRADAFLLPRHHPHPVRAMHPLQAARFLESLYIAPADPEDGKGPFPGGAFLHHGMDEDDESSVVHESNEGRDPFARLDNTNNNHANNNNNNNNNNNSYNEKVRDSLINNGVEAGSDNQATTSSSTTVNGEDYSADGIPVDDDDDDDDHEDAEAILNGIDHSTPPPPPPAEAATMTNGHTPRNVASAPRPTHRSEPTRFDPDQPMMNTRSRIFKMDTSKAPSAQSTQQQQQPSWKQFNPDQPMITNEKMIMKHTPNVNYRHVPNGNVPNAYMSVADPDRPMLDMSHQIVHKGGTSTSPRTRAPVWNGNMSDQYKESQDPNRPLLDTGKMIYHHAGPQPRNNNAPPPDSKPQEERAANNDGVPNSKQQQQQGPNRNFVAPDSGLNFQFDPKKSMLNMGDKFVRKGG